MTLEQLEYYETHPYGNYTYEAEDVDGYKTNFEFDLVDAQEVSTFLFYK